jgi:hypothetical protein
MAVATQMESIQLQANAKDGLLKALSANFFLICHYQDLTEVTIGSTIESGRLLAI